MYRNILFFLLVVTQVACTKLVEVNPPANRLNGPFVYANDATAASVLTGIYATLSAGSYLYGHDGITILTGLSSDELVPWSGVTETKFFLFYKNDLTGRNVEYGDFSPRIYSLIYKTNSAIEGLTASENLTPVIKQHLLGEAKFMRAFFYYYAINLHGPVPLALGTDYTINNALGRSTSQEIYNQIISDLKDAQQLLPDGYLNADAISVSQERVRPNKWAATALLARVYLHTADWSNCEMQASEIINNTNRYSLGTLDNTFGKNSSEAIWQMQPIFGNNTVDGAIFNIPELGPNGYRNKYYLTSFLLDSFETGDNRKTQWIGNVTAGGTTYYYPRKYKEFDYESANGEYAMVLRLGEQYLVRAEARAQLNNIVDAASDLDAIRNRAGLGNTTAATKEELLAAILHERQVELFTEGHRWFDIKRTGNADVIMGKITPLKGGTWNTNWQLYPFSESNLQHSPNMSQNPGY